jgi:hypothetical protein
MPCRSDYLEPSWKEKQLQRTAKLYAFALDELQMPVPLQVTRDGDDIYCSRDYVTALCKLIKSMTEEQVELIIYNARNKSSRDLADWWEDHQAADQERIANETTLEEMKRIKSKIYGKLTAEEVNFLKEKGL